MTSLRVPVILQVLWRWGNGESAGDDTGSSSREPAQDKWSPFTGPRQQWSPSASWVTKQPSLGPLCSPPYHENGARKGALNIACLNSPWPVYRDSWGSLLCSRNQRKMIAIKLISRFFVRHASPAKASWHRLLAVTHFFGADAAAKSGRRQEWDLPSQQHTSINSPAFLRVSTISLWKCSCHLDRRQIPLW